MSKDNFDKEIRKKLVNHKPEYDSGAWANFQNLLPQPWYTKLFQNYGAWGIGGLASTALLVTFYYNYSKTNLLHEEIATLKNQIENLQKVDTVFVQQNSVDTVYLVQKVPIYQKEVAYSDTETNENLAQQSLDGVKGESGIEINSEDEGASILSNNLNGEKEGFDSYSAIETDLPSSEKEDDLSKETDLGQDLNASLNDAARREEKESLPIENGDSAQEALAVVENSSNLEIETQAEEIEKPETANSEVIEELEEEIEPTRIIPEKTKKKLKLPKMRFGLTADYLSLKVFAFGPTMEFFILDKFSLNTGVLFSGQIETKHPFPRDFNKLTGKQFDREFQHFVNDQPEFIRDITIKTSIIKLPLYFNYYITTKSPFTFIASAGTKLDLSVYQDIGYMGGSFGQRMNKRFEAKPKPKTFNSMFYGMGVQYQYKNFVGQITPYFDFRFRKPEYFNPPQNFGINASVKFEIGN